MVSIWAVSCLCTVAIQLYMGVKDLAKTIRRINKGKKANEPIFDTEILTPGSIIAVDVNTFLVPAIKSNEVAAQISAVPVQSCTCIQDKLEALYLKKFKPRKWRMLNVFDASFNFKDEVIRASRNKIKEKAMQQLIDIRATVNSDTSLLKKLRRAEKGIVGVSNDVVANVVKWANKRPGITSVSACHNICTHTSHVHPPH